MDKKQEILNKELLRICKNYDSPNIVELLLNNGADVNAKDSHGNTALIYASIDGHKNMVELLLKNGADISIKNYYGNTPLILASKSGHKDVVKLLKQYGQIKNIK